MDLQRWLDDGGAGCCPDPIEDDFCPERDAILRHGYDVDTTPVDTLMNGPVSMHLQFADDMEAGPCRDFSREYANL